MRKLRRFINRDPKSQLKNHIRQTSRSSPTAICHSFLESINFLSSKHRVEFLRVKFLPKNAAWIRIELHISQPSRFNWNSLKFPIPFHLDLIVGVYVWCQKINFGDLKSGITQSSSDVKEFHLLLLSPPSQNVSFIVQLCLLVALGVWVLHPYL